MPYQRGDIVEVTLAMPPNGKTMNHPAVIILNDEVYKDDNCYTVIMLTSQEYYDVYSYQIEDYMFIQGSNTTLHSEVRCHLVTYVLSSHIVSTKRCRLKKQYVDEIVDHMVNSSLK